MNKIMLKILYLYMIINLTICPIAIATDAMYVWSPTSNSSISSTVTDSAITTSDSNIVNLDLESESAILIEQSTGQILYEKNPHEQLRPASVTKIMSILLIMEAIDSNAISLTDTVSCSSNARAMGGSQIWLNETELLTVDEMLKAICVVSANDCTVAMAEHLCGSQEAFVEKMNQRAKELGMNDTCFKNCHGIDEDGHVTSAYDISVMSRELLKNHPEITKYTTIWMDTLRDGKSQLVNTNRLVRNYDGCTGLKTGSTSLAMFNLSASATRNDLSLIAVVLKAPSTNSRFNDAKKLLDYGFSNFAYTSFAKQHDFVKTINVEKGVSGYVDIEFSEDAGTITSKLDSSQIVQSISLSDTITAPVAAGQKVGEATYTLNGVTLETVDLVAKSEVKKMSFINMSSSLYKTWFCLLRM